MNQHRTHFENLPNELFGIIFEYLAPHDLLHGFKKLNRRFQSILIQQPLSLPNNRSMSYKLYCNYLIKIIPRYISQIVYLHLSERRAPHAVQQFIDNVPLDSQFWPALKAVTIEDVPRDVFETLLADCSFLVNIQSLTLDSGFQLYHCDEYDECDDFGAVIPILNSLPKLRSLYLRIVNRPVIYVNSTPNELASRMDIHQHLQILSIDDCSRELLVELLNNGYLPRLRQLHVSITSHKHSDMSIDPPNPIPLKQVFAPELRQVNIKLFTGVTWFLTFFEDLQRHSQLDCFKLSGHVRFTNNSSFPRVAALQRWLTLTKSNIFQFRMKLSVDYNLGAQSVLEDICAEYRRATGDEYSAGYGNIDIRYPEMSFSYPPVKDDNIADESVVMNEGEDNSTSSDNNISDEPVVMDVDESNSTTSDEWFRDEPLDENIKEMELSECDYVNNGLFKELQEIPCWHRLQRITIDYEVPMNENYIFGKKLTRLAHVIQCSPQLRELYIEQNLQYGHALASNTQLGILLACKLEVFCYTVSHDTSSLGDLAQIVDTLFSHSLSPPCLKELILKVNGHPSTWLSTKHLVRWIAKLFKRFPVLIHFTLNCQPSEAYEHNEYSLSKLAPKWFGVSLLSRRIRPGQIEYRHKPHSLDIWL
ncbi:unnamed protein product [Adineta steineri]|uniref:F-box domain-containing protein n=1 Tax=Adineta steineri TaxID=433720 RepID=A0A813TZP0_9BILA|nr:unnamed protein product [Adineta steineri]